MSIQRFCRNKSNYPEYTIQRKRTVKISAIVIYSKLLFICAKISKPTSLIRFLQSSWINSSFFFIDCNLKVWNTCIYRYSDQSRHQWDNWRQHRSGRRVGIDSVQAAAFTWKLIGRITWTVVRLLCLRIDRSWQRPVTRSVTPHERFHLRLPLRAARD